TGAAARHRVHAMRRAVDAVMVGIGTASADDPMLNARGVGAGGRAVRRVVVDPRLRLSLGSRLVRTAAEAPVTLLHGPDAPQARHDALRQAGVTLIAVPPVPRDQRSVHGQPVRLGDALDLAAGLRALGDAGVSSVFCEGGGTLAAALLAARLVDEVVFFTAGRVFGAAGVPGIGTLAPAPLAGMPA
ncbi:MAG: RibD family protein, partial [Pseudomonadota bacterium]